VRHTAGITVKLGKQTDYRRPYRVLRYACVIASLLIGLNTSVLKAQDGSPASFPEAADKSNATAGLAGTPDQATDVASDVSFKNLPTHILRDQKELWLFPVSLAHKKHWVPTIAVIGVTGALIVMDKHEMPFFRRTSSFEGFSDVFSGTSTGAVEIGVPAAFMAVGLLRHDSYAEHTALLAGEAYLDSAIPHVVIKLLSRRLRPVAVAPKGDFSDTFFRSNVSVLGKGSSFPSGHAAGAFSIATVIAQRYKSHRWVPWVAYGLAGVISFSRVPDLAHYPSDVFLGAALGYAITRYDVFRTQ
jgi:membrane-associated phospholipid phosphatase